MDQPGTKKNLIQLTRGRHKRNSLQADRGYERDVSPVRYERFFCDYFML